MCEQGVNFHRIVNTTKNADVKKIFTILAEGEDEFCQPKHHKNNSNAILVLGNAQSGKTAFARWMAEKDAKFESKKDLTTPGGYIIFDPDGLVGASSPTCVPELVTEDNTSQIYYDFSGFFDPRGVPYVIASTYFTKKVIENFSNVKMCFLINHAAITSGGTRDEFTNFIKQIVRLVGNVEKFQKSIVLVATKVNNQYSNLDDNEIVYPMVNYIELVKQNLVEQINVDNSKALKFLNELTIKAGQTYPRIALFRSPNKEASLRNISLLQENKKQVGKTLQNLLFTETNSKDFAYNVPKASLYDIIAITEEERYIITKDVARGGEQIENFFKDKEKLPPSNEAPFDLSIKHVLQELYLGYQNMLAIEKSISTNPIVENPKECLTKIIKGVANMSSSIELHLSSTLDECEAFYFLQTIAGQSTKLECAEGLKNVIKHLGDSHIWYLFIKRLYDRLLNCNISRDMGIYNITNKDLNKKVSDTDLKRFLLKDPQEPLYFQYNDIKNITLTEFKLNSVKTVANVTIVYRKSNLLCNGNYSSNDNKPSIEDLYGTRGYLNDLYLLEKQLYTAENRTWFLPFYKSLDGRVERYIEKRSQNETYFGDFKALRYLRLVTASRICNINNGLEDYLVVDIQGYFTLVDQHLDDYTKALKNVQIRTYKAQYEDTINKQILEAFAIIQESIMPEIDKVYNQIYDQIQQLLEVIEELEKQAKQNLKELTEQRNKLAAQLPILAFLQMLKVFTAALSFFGPQGAVAAGASGLIISAAEGYLKPSDSAATSMVKASKEMVNSLKNYYKSEKESLQKLLKSVKKINESPDIMEKILKDDDYKKMNRVVNSFDQLLDQESVTEKEYFKEKTHTKDHLERYQQKLKKEKEQSQHDPDAEKKLKKIGAIDKWLSKVQTAISVAEVGINAIKDYRNSEKVISGIDSQIDQVNKLINKLKDNEQSIRDNLVPEIDHIAKNVTDVLVHSANQPHAVLDRNNFLLKDLISDFTVEIDIMLSSLNQDALVPIRKRVLGCINKLENGISTTLQIYDRIQDYTDQAKLAKLIADLSTGDTDNDDPDLKADIDQLEIQTKSNLIFQEYEQVLNIYKQYIFPFAQIYLTRFNISPYLKPGNVENRVSAIRQDIRQLRQDIIFMSTTVSQHGDTVFSDVRFDIQNVEQKPFFIWQYDTYKAEISKLLQGRRATLQANILQNHLAPNAVKFKEIGIQFLLQNKTTQSELKELMSKFMVEMSHLGNSHYGCGSKYYIFNHNKMTMIHSVNTENGIGNKPQYYYIDETTRLIRENSPIFSPYADWEIQLQNRTGASVEENNRNFEQLKKFQNLTVDVALEGRGSHIQQNTKACKNDLSEYYKFGGMLTTSRRARSISAIRGFNFNIYEWLTWADFLFRWVTKVRPYSPTPSVSYVNSTDVRVSVLNLIEEFEQIIRNASQKFKVPIESLSFEVVPLMSELEKKTANGNRTTVGDILYQSVVNITRNSSSYNSLIGNYTRNEIDKMLKRKHFLI